MGVVWFAAVSLVLAQRLALVGARHTFVESMNVFPIHLSSPHPGVLGGEGANIKPQLYTRCGSRRFLWAISFGPLSGPVREVRSVSALA